MIGSFFSGLLIWAMRVLTLDGLVEWHKFLRMLGVIRLLAYRSVLRRQNMFDTSMGMPKDAPEPPKDYLTARMPRGRFNDLDDPNMGSAGDRFGRNFPLDRVKAETGQELITPSPRKISLELMTRRKFQPAISLNVLAAAWIQFMVHTWVDHGDNPPEEPIEIPLQEDDEWTEKPMRIKRTLPDSTRAPGNGDLPDTFINKVTHWWDGSQIYGSNAEELAELRSEVDGKVPIGSDGLLPLNPKTGIDKTGFSNNYWIGLSVLHTLFTLEHNAICDQFRAEYPSWSDDELFNHARLVNTALMAKIHTVEWTPAIIAHPTTEYVMRASWWGILGERFHRKFGRIGGGSTLSGYPGSNKSHYGVPFSLTEEFVTVYRLHPLLPDDFRFHSAFNNEFLNEWDLIHIAGKHTRSVQDQISMTDIIYSLSTSNPGAMKLHNFPKTLQEFHEQKNDDLIDLAAIDILRDRERGVPRYNEFRRLIHRKPVKTFEELTGGGTELAEEIRQVYDGDIDRVDVQIGMLAEPLPHGFGFSDTAFRIFIVMAGRRLTSDRFFTTDYNTKIYKQVGMNWIKDNDMSSVLRRHYPNLAPSLEKVENAFKPWPMEARPGTDWKEVYAGGSKAAEEGIIRGFIDQIKEVQTKNKEKGQADTIQRAFHARILAGVTNAEFRISPDVPSELRTGIFQPGNVYPATVRLSNASGTVQADTEKDLRGAAFRVTADEGVIYDFLMTNADPNHARNAEQFMKIAAAAARAKSKIGSALGLILALGPFEGIRVIRTVSKQMAAAVKSMATETYWRRAPIKFGQFAVKYSLHPGPGVSQTSRASGDAYLRDDLIARLKDGPVVFQFKIQRFINETRTPIEDGSKKWESAPQTIAELVIPQQDLLSSEGSAMEDEVNNTAFNPWNTSDDFRPLGSLNRARSRVYETSADFRRA